MEIKNIFQSIIAILLIAFNLSYSKDNIMVIHPKGKAFSDAVEGIKSEIEEDEYNLKIFKLKNLDEKKLKSKITLLHPKAIILMDNKAVSLYKRTHITDSIAVLTMMGVNIQNSTTGIPNSGSISYEIPLVTSLINLRNVLNIKIDKIGIISRPNMKNFINQNKLFCANEKIKIININLATNNKNKIEKYIKKGLKILATKKHVQAIWIPNDMKLVNSYTITKIWVPLLKKYHLPAVVGIEKFLDKKLKFGTFAVLPDHYSLGSQAAQALMDISENNWTFEKNFNEPPIGVYTIVNKQMAKKINKNINFENVDKIIK